MLGMKELRAYEDPRVELWEGEIIELILKCSEGQLNKVASNAHNGLDAWRKIKWYFEPKLAQRANMYLTTFTALSEVASEKLVPEALENLELLAKQYEECSGKAIGPELKMVTVLSILPKELRSKVRAKLEDEEDYDKHKMYCVCNAF